MKDDRREFLKKIGIAGAGMAIMMNPFVQALSAQEMNKNVRIGIIGTGSRGNYLLEHLLRIKEEFGGFEIVALCDNYEPNLNNAIKKAQHYKVQCKTYSDHTKLISDNEVDGVIIATPLFQHAHIAIDCMKAGIHVLCEKSMARTLEDTKAMYDTHIATGSVLLIGHQRLFSSKYNNAMQRIHNGDLGIVSQMHAHWHRGNDWRRPVPADKPNLERQINWRLYKEYSAGLLTELMSHQIQVANWAKQQIPVSVMGTGSIRYWNDGREVNDNFAAIFSYADGTKFTYDTQTINKRYGCEEEIIGDKGSFELETNRYYSTTPPKPEPAPGIAQLVGDIQNGMFKSVPIGGPSWAPETKLKYTGEPIFEGRKGDGTKEELVEFVQFVKKGKMPNWLLKEGYYASIWTLLTEQAIDTGTLVTMPEKYRI
ncbi:hyaluronate lyase [Labilibaculum filiforme]|uniref:Hyaluronate lyase n=1 Tax=Labilibaculum filiforme TaxID=1940526 RepID=A0A2N3I1R8_9BACT|nr:Gfo/Idh/MocA family oxidoreductase [Labilibaculum filiforme]PKQ64250.1 hyaluronate lyase [Labilibaculum filiforme]